MISCLTVTRGGRWPLLCEAIADFARQSHPERELVIVYNEQPGFATALSAQIAGHGDAIAARVHAHMEPADLPLGALRNRAVAHARGEFVCQWDDDDRCHPQRLRRQLETLTGAGADACFLVDQLHLFMPSGELFWSDWNCEPYPFDLVPGTLLARKAALPDYPELRLGEDGGVVTRLLATGRRIARLRGEPWLSVYRFHGGNTFDAAHHRAIVRLKAANAARLLSNEARLRARIGEFDPGLGPMAIAHEAGRMVFA